MSCRPTGPGFVTGLAAEARIARRLGSVAVGGGTPDGAARAARSLADGALVSFGLAGGLDPALRPGALIVPEAVLYEGQQYATDPALSAWLGGMSDTLLVATAQVVARAADKGLLRRQTGAVAVDLESGAVAHVAAARGVPFAVLRAVCDPAEADLPPAALLALDQAGAIGLARVLGSVARRPGQIAALLRLARDAAAARAALIRRVGDIAVGGRLVG